LKICPDNLPINNAVATAQKKSVQGDIVMTKFRLLASASLLTCLLTTPALAQSETDDDAPPQREGLQEIVVTAQRRQESVQDVPIAISAFSANELAARGASSAIDVAQYVPNLVGLNNTGLGSANAYYLRGLGNTESIATFDPPIGTYVDDIYLSRQNANNLSLFDVERLEVLRGPQGTLFGRNTTGGAINLILREPGDSFGGYVEAGYGSYDKVMARGSVDIPLAESFAIKVSGYWQDDRGYVKNTTTGERLNDNDGWGARIGLRGELSPAARWTGSYAHIVSNAENSLNFDCDPANPSNCDGRFATTGFSERNGADGGLAGIITGSKQFYGNNNRTAMDLITSNLEFGGDLLKVNVITGYVSLTQRFALDFADGRALPSLSVPTPAVLGVTYGGFTIANRGQHEQFTQEVKATGSFGDGLIDYVAGVYYFREWNDTDFADVFNVGLPFVLADRRLQNETEAWAGYAQVDLNVTDQIKLTAGIRYTDEDKTFDISDNRPARGTNASGRLLCQGTFAPGLCLDNANLIAANGAIIPTKQNVGIWTPRFAVNFEPTDDILLFASATRGFKSGGWNARGTDPGTLLPFNPERVWSYEAGVKSEFLNHRVRVNLTAYYLDTSGLQTPSALVNPTTGALTFITRNFADYENKGIELEFNAVPIDGLNIFAAVGYQDDEYKIDRNAPAFDAFGVQSVAAQQAACQAQLAAGLVPLGRDPDSTGPLPTENAPACGVGIVAPDGSIAEPVRTPRWSLALGASYAAELGGSGLTLTPSVNASFRSRSQTGTSEVSFYTGGFTGPFGATYPANTDGGDFITGSLSPSYWIVNSSLTLRDSERGWQIAVECNNCFDEEANQSTLANYTYLNAPRTWLVRGKFDF